MGVEERRKPEPHPALPSTPAKLQPGLLMELPEPSRISAEALRAQIDLVLKTHHTNRRELEVQMGRLYVNRSDKSAGNVAETIAKLDASVAEVIRALGDAYREALL